MIEETQIISQYVEKFADADLGQWDRIEDVLFFPRSVKLL